jgi:hypothetical protein
MQRLLLVALAAVTVVWTVALLVVWSRWGVELCTREQRGQGIGLAKELCTRSPKPGYAFTSLFPTQNSLVSYCELPRDATCPFVQLHSRQQKSKRAGVSLVTILTTDRLDRLKRLAMTWQGGIAAVVQVCGSVVITSV